MAQQIFALREPCRKPVAARCLTRCRAARDITRQFRGSTKDGVMYFGQRLRRREDQRFLTGNGQYSDDFTLPNILSLSVELPITSQNVWRALNEAGAA